MNQVIVKSESSTVSCLGINVREVVDDRQREAFRNLYQKAEVGEHREE